MILGSCKKTNILILVTACIALSACSKKNVDVNDLDKGVSATSRLPAAPDGTVQSETPPATASSVNSTLNHIVAVNNNYSATREFSWNTVAVAALSMGDKSGLTPLDKVDKSRLASFFMPNEFSQSNGNVFKMKSLEPQAEILAKNAIQSFDLNEPYEINTKFDFDSNYNFKTNSFPLSPLKEGSLFYTSGTILNADNTLDGPGSSPGWPIETYNVYFDNPQIINNLQMDQKDAEAFANRRTRNGAVDTSISAKIDFVITGFKTNSAGILPSKGDLIAHIVKATLLHNDGSVLFVYK